MKKSKKAETKEMETKNVHPLARPYFFPGEKAGCLLIHGFTGSPPELFPLAEYLARCGYAVAAPLLAGHGTRLEDLARTSWQEWLDSARRGLKQLAAEPVEKLFLLGLSMGGLLALLLAAAAESQTRAETGEAQKPLGGIVTINSPIWLKDRRVRWAFLLQAGEAFFLRRGGLPKESEGFPWPAGENCLPGNGAGSDAGSSSFSGEGDPWRERRFAYSHTSPRSLVQLLRVIRCAKRSLPEVKAPALVVQSKSDETVEPRSAEYIYRCLGSKDKQLLWVEEAPHVLPLCTAAGEQVFPRIARFIEEHTLN